MLPEHIVLFADDGLPGSRIVVSALSPGVRLQLQPTFIVCIKGLPKGFGIGRVYQNRHAHLSAFVPDRIQPRVVDRHSIAIDIHVSHAQALVDLQAPCTILDVSLKLGHGILGPIRASNAFEIHIGKNNKSIRIVIRYVLDGFLQLFPGSAAQVDHNGQVECIHSSDYGSEILFGHAVLVPVDVDKRIFGPLDGFPRDDKCRLGIVFLKREFLG